MILPRLVANVSKTKTQGMQQEGGAREPKRGSECNEGKDGCEGTKWWEKGATRARTRMQQRWENGGTM